MPDTIVLRFRDLIADGITEHRRLITEAGYVWWGWWKKNEEPDRSAELDQIKAQLANGSIEIGLFDRSGRGRFFKASLLECVHYGSRSIPSPEKRATPAYYRNDSVSAWLKLSRIDELAENDPSFKQLFSVIPVGEATLFPVWFDKPQKTRAAGVGNTFPNSVSTDGDVILHISDVHFGEFAYPDQAGPGKYPLTDILVADLEKVQARIGLIIVSGDLTTRADSGRLFNEGLPFLRELVRRLKVTPEQVVIVPGNHDIPLRNHNPMTYSHENAYISFLREFYDTNVGLMQVRRFTMGGRSVELLTMNSTRLRSKELKEFGYVEWPLYEPLLRGLIPSDAIRIAVLHHHLVAAPREESPDPQYPEAAISITLDAGAIIEGLQTYGFHVVLHGHQHVPRLTKISRGRVQDNFGLAGLDQPLFVIGGGSVGTSRLFDEMRDNTYNLLFLGPAPKKELRLLTRRFNPGVLPRNYIDQTFSL
jgi:predicted MPP superfamily phosphohydrolase